jgi:Fur family transcriptional regulator, zinc uptake regulator
MTKQATQPHHAHDHDHDAPAPPLTRNQQLVLERLRQSAGPLTAYGILDQLRDNGIKAPLQVYRALDKLVASGLAHRLDSINAFVSCRHSGSHDEASMVFLICDECGGVEEARDDQLNARIAGAAAAREFNVTRSAVEVHGRCAGCATK